jgi:hypothetical protein
MTMLPSHVPPGCISRSINCNNLDDGALKFLQTEVLRQSGYFSVYILRYL